MWTTAATKALYPLLCGKSKLSLRNKRQLYLSYIQPIMTYASAAWIYDSTARGASSATEQFTACSDKGALSFVRNDCSSPGPSAGPFKHCLLTPCRGSLLQAHQAH
jgi:hypothetical protein